MTAHGIPGVSLLQIGLEATAFGTAPASFVEINPFDFTRYNIGREFIDYENQLANNVGHKGGHVGLHTVQDGSFKFWAHSHGQTVTAGPAGWDPYFDVLFESGGMMQSDTAGKASDCLYSTAGTPTVGVLTITTADASDFTPGSAIVIMEADEDNTAAIIVTSVDSGALDADATITLDRDTGNTAGAVTFTGGYSYALDSSDMDTLVTDQNRASFSIEQEDMNSTNVRQGTGCVVTGINISSENNQLWLEFLYSMSKVTDEGDTPTTTGTSWTEPNYMDAHNYDFKINNGTTITDSDSLAEFTLNIELTSAYEADLTSDQARGGALITKVAPKMMGKNLTDAGADGWVMAWEAEGDYPISLLISPSGTFTSGDLIGIYFPALQITTEPLVEDGETQLISFEGIGKNAAAGDVIISFA